jgi:phage-related protein
MASELASAYVALYPKLKTANIAAQLKSIDASSAGDSVGRSFGGSFGGAAATAAKAGLAALAAAAAAAVAGVVKVTGAALESYASYEQLVGGVDTLFKESSGKLQAYAAGAYKTAGMSANQYMEQATSFSASLLQSLGGDTEAAVEYANMAITDMSDNANKMGTNMGRITDAYQGFAKQNFTMLDNLKLGYGGTQEEMQRLLDDAEKISGIKYDISSYADIVDAIHVVQKEMGITGTTAQEAAATIEGSVAMAKAAYSNWLTGLADENADLDALTGQLVDSVVTAAGNIIPRLGRIVGTALGSIPQLVEKVGPELASSLGTMLSTAFETVKGSLPQGMQESIAAATGSLQEAFGPIVSEIGEKLPSAIATAQEWIGRLVDAFAPVAEQFAGTLAAALSTASTFIESLGSAIGQWVIPALEQLAPMIEGFLESVQRMYEALQPVADFLGTVLGAALSLVVALFGGIVQAVTFVIDSLAGFVEFLTGLPQSVSQFVTDVGNFFSQLPGLVKLWFDQAISAAVSWAASMVSQAVTAGSEFVNAVVSFVSSLPGKVAGFAGQMASAAGDMIRGMVSGVQGAAGAVWDAIVNVCSGALDAVKSFFGIASPSKVMKATFKWIPLGAAEGIDAAAGSVAKSMAAMGVGAVSAAAKVADAIAAPFSNMAISAPRMSSAGYGASNGTVLTAKKNGALTKDDVFDAMDKALSRFEGRPIIVIVKADDREIARVVRKYA